MKAYFKKIAALTAAALLVLSMAACGGNDDEDTTGTDTANSNAVVEDMPADDTNASEDASADASDTAASEDGSAASDSADSSDSSKDSSSSNSSTLSKDEAVALFNKATASAKSMKGNRYTAVNIVKVPGGDFLKNAISVMLPDPNKATALTGVPNTTMQAGDFSSVTAKKSGNNWVLTMNVKAETAPNNAANARAFAELPQKDIDNALGGLKVSPADSVQFIYSGGSITATVTADGKLVSATYTMKVEVSVKNAKALGVVKIDEAKVTVTQTDKFGA